MWPPNPLLHSDVDCERIVASQRARATYMTRQSAGVLIIGAGVAGLAAAQRLSGAGIHVTMVGARNPIGGRVFIHHDPLCPAPGSSTATRSESCRPARFGSTPSPVR